MRSGKFDGEEAKGGPRGKCLNLNSRIETGTHLIYDTVARVRWRSMATYAYRHGS